ncbi:hypothetical protein ACFSTC_14430 [Nonomuraea ferruginea]
MLVTSRQPLFLGGTHDTRLGPFSEAHGVELLARLARRRAGLRGPGVRQGDRAALRLPAAGHRHLRRPPGHPRAVDAAADGRPAGRRAPPPGPAGAGAHRGQERAGLGAAQLRRLHRHAAAAAAAAQRPQLGARRARLGGGRAARHLHPGRRRPAGGADRRPARRVLGHRPDRHDALPAARPGRPVRRRAGGRRRPGQARRRRRARPARLPPPRRGGGAEPLAAGLEQGRPPLHRRRPDPRGRLAERRAAHVHGDDRHRQAAGAVGADVGGCRGRSARCATRCAPTGPTGRRPPTSAARPPNGPATGARGPSPRWTAPPSGAGRAARSAAGRTPSRRWRRSPNSARRGGRPGRCAPSA